MDNAEWPAPDPPPLEVKKYGADATPEERAALDAQVYVFAPGIIKFTEAPMLSPTQYEVYEAKLKRLAEEYEEFRLLIDLTFVVVRPNAADRAWLKKLFLPLTSKISACAVYTGKNFLLNMAAKFVLGGLNFKELSVNKTREQALEALGYVP